MDQDRLSTPGRLLTYSGKSNKEIFVVVSLFVDSVSEKVFCEFQYPTSAEETVESKIKMERVYRESNVRIIVFRSDNGVYKAIELRNELDKNDQNVTFCGTGTHKQNGITERDIRTMVEKARTVLLNAHDGCPTSI